MPFRAAGGELQIHGVQGFPRGAADALAAKGSGAKADRQVAAVAWAAAEYAVYRLPRLAGNMGRGLRGGRSTVKRVPSTAKLTLERVRFSTDVVVSGTVTLKSETSRIDGRFRITGKHVRRFKRWGDVEFVEMEEQR